MDRNGNSCDVLDDNDIDIDIGPTPVTQNASAPEYEDLFMIDYEDDNIVSKTVENTAKPAPIATSIPVAQEDIDYSDDEDWDPFPLKPKTPTTPTVKPYFMSVESKRARDAALALQPQIPTSSFGFGFAGIPRTTPPQTTGSFDWPPNQRPVKQETQKETNDLANGGQHDREEEQEEANDFPNEEGSDHVIETENDGPDTQTDGDDNGAVLPAPDNPANTNASQDGYYDEHSSVVQGDDAQEQQSAQDNGVQEQPSALQGDDLHERQFSSRTITVNFQGNELWLFKEYDEDDSGDWLLEDMSVLSESIKDLFNAIRASLANEVLPGTELGFRLDHMHNMEIFEDSTACVAVSLERVVNLYHTLLDQDGIDDHDSFYIYLLARPRFAALLNDVMKYAEHGAGYSGFNAAVVAGETRFPDAFSGVTPEHASAEKETGEALENDGQNEDLEQNNEVEYTEYDDELHGEVPVDEANIEEEYTGHEGFGLEYGGNGGEQERKNAQADLANGASADGAAHSEQILSHESTQAAFEQVQASASSAQPIQDQTRGAAQGSNSPPKAQQKRVEEDVIDYSDEEEDDPPQSAKINTVSTSSTVQGDASGVDTNPTRPEGEQYTDHDNTSYEAEYADDNHSHVEEQLGYGEDTEPYQDYTQTYGEDDVADGSGFNIAQNWVNEDLNDYTNQGMTQQLQNDSVCQDGLDSTNIVNDFAGEEDFLDLDDLDNPDYPAVWAPGQEPVAILPGDDVFPEEEEDGAVEQPEAGASTTADPVAASSTDLQDTSPSGQKRSIDEVGDSIGDAIDETDLKRPRV